MMATSPEGRPSESADFRKSRFERAGSEFESLKQVLAQGTADELNEAFAVSVNKLIVQDAYGERGETLDQARERCRKIFKESGVFDEIRRVGQRDFSRKPGANIVNDLVLHKAFFKLLDNYCPQYLRLAVEVLINVQFDTLDDFASNFRKHAKQLWFTAPRIAKNPKFAYGAGRKIYTDLGLEEAYIHFLIKTLQLVPLMDMLVRDRVILSNNRMFTLQSKCQASGDIVSAVSREFAPGSLNVLSVYKMCGYVPQFEETFLHKYVYRLENLFDGLGDGVMLARLMENVHFALTGQFRKVDHQLRDPINRLNKLYNLKSVLQFGVGIGLLPREVDYSAEEIHSGNKEKTLSLLKDIFGLQNEKVGLSGCVFHSQKTATTHQRLSHVDWCTVKRSGCLRDSNKMGTSTPMNLPDRTPLRSTIDFNELTAATITLTTPQIPTPIQRRLRQHQVIEEKENENGPETPKIDALTQTARTVIRNAVHVVDGVFKKPVESQLTKVAGRQFETLSVAEQPESASESVPQSHSQPEHIVDEESIASFAVETTLKSSAEPESTQLATDSTTVDVGCLKSITMENTEKFITEAEPIETQTDAKMVVGCLKNITMESSEKCSTEPVPIENQIDAKRVEDVPLVPIDNSPSGPTMTLADELSALNTRPDESSGMPKTDQNASPSRCRLSANDHSVDYMQLLMDNDVSFPTPVKTPLQVPGNTIPQHNNVDFCNRDMESFSRDLSTVHEESAAAVSASERNQNGSQSVDAEGLDVRHAKSADAGKGEYVQSSVGDRDCEKGDDAVKASGQRAEEVDSQQDGNAIQQQADQTDLQQDEKVNERPESVEKHVEKLGDLAVEEIAVLNQPTGNEIPDHSAKVLERTSETLSECDASAKTCSAAVDGIGVDVHSHHVHDGVGCCDEVLTLSKSSAEPTQSEESAFPDNAAGTPAKLLDDIEGEFDRLRLSIPNLHSSPIEDNNLPTTSRAEPMKTVDFSDVGEMAVKEKEEPRPMVTSFMSTAPENKSLLDNSELQKHAVFLVEQVRCRLKAVSSRYQHEDRMRAMLANLEPKKELSSARAATIIQSTWRSFRVRKQMPDLIARLRTRVEKALSKPCTESDPRADRVIPMLTRMTRYVPILASPRHADRLMAASFINRSAEVCPDIMVKFVERGGVDAIAETGMYMVKTYADLILQRELSLLYNNVVCYAFDFLTEYIHNLTRLLIRNIQVYRPHNRQPDPLSVEIFALTVRTLLRMTLSPRSVTVMKKGNLAYYLHRVIDLKLTGSFGKTNFLMCSILKLLEK